MSLLKMRQTQTEILQKTRIADQGSFQAKRDKWTETLKLQQDTLMIDLTDTQISLAEESFNPLFDDAHTAMFESSEFLSREIVDSKAQSSQNEAKDFLSDLINLMIEGQGQGSDKQNQDELSAMALMQFLRANRAKVVFEELVAVTVTRGQVVKPARGKRTSITRRRVVF